jgi:7-cyano-7-deazaguanine synthase
MKKACVVLSGGMDSSLCLAIAVNEFGAENVLAISFDYNQRHSKELDCASKIANEFKVEHVVLELPILAAITNNALTNSKLKIEKNAKDSTPNTMVLGRNGLFARLASIQAYGLGIKKVYLGVIEVEEANSGYRDCSRKYMDLIESALRLDFNDDGFEIVTPIIKMTKQQTMERAFNLGCLKFLLDETITCYEGTPKFGCGKCPACKLRNEGISSFLKDHPEFTFSYRSQF